jgi:hypothetical protein
MNRHRVAHAKATNVDRPGHLPPYQGATFFKLDVTRAKAFSALP